MTNPIPTLLGPNDAVADHPITLVENYASDIALLNYLLQDLRALTRRAAKSEITLVDQQVITWEVHGLGRRTVVCDPTGLIGNVDVQIVGFFGDRRTDADREAVDDGELNLIDELGNHPGILSYSSVELVDDYWANLVVHRAPGDRETWRQNTVHQHVVDRVAPNAYHGVRIHNGRIRGGVPGTETVVLEHTKYWDYDVSPTWHAIRHLPGGETATLTGPVAEPGESDRT